MLERPAGIACGYRGKVPAKLCACGCGKGFQPATTRDKYATEGCRDRAKLAREKLAWLRRKNRKEKACHKS
jgi:hypothetical protein